MRILCLRLQPRGLHAAPSEFDHLRLAPELEEFSPRIGWYEWDGGDCLCLDVAGTAHWFGGETALLDRLQEWCDERRLACSATLADTLGAAWALQWSLLDRQAVFARSVAAAGAPVDVLSSLPVEALRVSTSTAALLRELGLAAIGPLFHLPREALAERFEPELLDRMDQVTGDLAEVFTPYRPEPQFSAEQLWEYGITTADLLAEVWKRLLPKFLRPVAELGHGVSRLVAELIGESDATRRLAVGLLRPTVDGRHLLDLLRLKLETVQLREPIIGTRLTVLETAPLAVQQQVLFADLAPPTELHAWTSLVERLAGRLGTDRVLRIHPQDDHEPERAWRGTPWIGRSGRVSNRRRRATVKDRQEFPLRPTMLLPQPRLIRVFAVAPQGHPQRFDDGRRELRVVRSWGPERIETGWWRGPSLRRDYFRVETETGSQVWLFRDLRTRRWFLHGWFD